MLSEATSKFHWVTNSHTTYRDYVGMVRKLLTHITNSPWNRYSMAFKWDDQMTITQCGEYVLDPKTGLYNYKSDQYVMLQSGNWPNTIQFQCVNKPSTENIATFKFGYHPGGNVYDLLGYRGPAFDTREYTTSNAGECGVEHSDGAIKHYHRAKITHTYRDNKLEVHLHIEDGFPKLDARCEYTVPHTSLEDKLKIVQEDGVRTFRFIEHKWRLVKCKGSC